MVFRLGKTQQWVLLWISVETSFIQYLINDPKSGTCGEISKCEDGIKIFQVAKSCISDKELHQAFTKLSDQKGDR